MAFKRSAVRSRLAPLLLLQSSFFGVCDPVSGFFKILKELAGGSFCRVILSFFGTSFVDRSTQVSGGWSVEPCAADLVWHLDSLCSKMETIGQLACECVGTFRSATRSSL